ncbi:MAG: hypothetical protein ABI895_18025 [Deltaproteobacteria bacterium]
MLVPACGDAVAEVEVPNVSTCSPAWQPLFAQADGLEPISLALGDDALWFRAFEGKVSDPDGGRPFIESISLQDGQRRTLIEAQVALLWVEGNTLSYSPLGSPDSLFSVPLAGGAPARTLDADHHVASSEGFASGLDAQHLYWTERDERPGDSIAIWRAARAGGAPERFATLEELAPSARFWLGREGLIAAGSGKSSLLPLDGSAARALAEVDAQALGSLSPLGFDGMGTYWSRLIPGSGEPTHKFEIVRAPATSAALQSFWTEMPTSFAAAALWPDGDSGWWVSGSENFDDGREHTEIWFVDAAEHGHRWACDPGGSGGADLAVPALSAEAGYFVVLAQDARTWSIVRVPRQ